MTSILLGLAFSSSPALAALPYVADTAGATVELQAVVERDSLDLSIDGERLGDWEDGLDIVNATGGPIELFIADAVDAEGTTWTVTVTAWEGRRGTAWTRDADGAWTLVDGELSWDVQVVAQAAKGKNKIKYGPVITVKPKG